MLSSIIDAMRDYLPLLIVLVASVLFLGFAHFLLIRRPKVSQGSLLFRQLILLSLTLVALISIILALPISETSRGDLLSLLGLVFTGVFALSSTSFVANAMAGFMLRAVKSYNVGDFVRVNDNFGRITERNLFHTEIQSEDRDLITLPNLYLTTHPVKVVRASGTVISCELSLGYDIAYYQVEPLLIQAGADAGLEDPFVQLRQLGDYAITYRVAGFCTEVRHMLTVKTRLHKAVLDRLHGAGIEIVSPGFVNQRRLDEREQIIAPARSAVLEDEKPEDKNIKAPEQGIFDKADKAEKIDTLKKELAVLKEQARLGNKDDDDNKHSGVEQRIKQLEDVLRVATETLDDD